MQSVQDLKKFNAWTEMFVDAVQRLSCQKEMVLGRDGRHLDKETSENENNIQKDVLTFLHTCSRQIQVCGIILPLVVV